MTSHDSPAASAAALNAASARRSPGVVPSEISAMSHEPGTCAEANLRPVPKPVVSVVVPTRNRAGYLDVTLTSLADQDFAEPYEVIVVDDGSRDRTPEVIAAHGVRSVTHDAPHGPNAARNLGVQMAEADLIAYVDDDVF